MKNSYCVYKHTVPNGKVYIGITSCDVTKRWANGHGYKDNKEFFNDIILYGWLNIKHEILYSGLSEHNARDIEARLIGEYESYKKAKGYNKSIGYSYGYVEKPVYIDYRVSMTRGEYLELCQTDNYKLLCVPESAHCTKVYQYTLNGEFVTSYNSIGLCAKALNVCKKCIRDCLSGKQKTCKGFKLSKHPPG